MPITTRETQLIHYYITENDLCCRKCQNRLTVVNILSIETVEKEILRMVQTMCPGCGVYYFIDPKFITGL